MIDFLMAMRQQAGLITVRYI